VLAYHTTSTRAARLIAQQGFRVPQRSSHSATDAPGMGGTFFRTIFVTKKMPSTRAREVYSSMPYGPALITVRLSGKYIPFQLRPGELFVDGMQRHIRTAKRLGVAGVDMGRDDYGIMVVDPRAIRIVSIDPHRFGGW
jgi:hypothetical protein